MIYWFLFIFLRLFIYFIEETIPSIAYEVECINRYWLSPVLGLFITTRLLLSRYINTSFSGFTYLIEIYISLTVIRHGLIFLLMLCIIGLITLRSPFAMYSSHALQTSCWIESLLTNFVIASYFLIQIIDPSATMIALRILS